MGNRIEQNRNVYFWLRDSSKQGFSHQDEPDVNCGLARWEAFRAIADVPVVPGSLSRPAKDGEVGRGQCDSCWPGQSYLLLALVCSFPGCLFSGGESTFCLGGPCSGSG